MDRRSALVQSRGFEHRQLKIWRRLQFNAECVLVAVSGGVDSVVLLKLLSQWSQLLQLRLKVAHVHHGRLRGKQGVYRDRVQAQVSRLARDLGMEFVTNQVAKSYSDKSSESELRDFRWKLLNRWRKEWREQLGREVTIATAHTLDDLLETRILRLIRGTGAEGLRAMSFRDPRCMRPLLYASKSEILQYANAKKLSWLEDPSNREVEPMRNWLRRKWLPQLEKKSPGGRQNLAASLERILEALSLGLEAGSLEGKNTLDRARLKAEIDVKQRQMVASYFRAIGLSGYSKNHVEELLKRLNTTRAEFSFEMLGRVWKVTSQTIVASSN